jgi:HEAT repeat protein
MSKPRGTHGTDGGAPGLAGTLPPYEALERVHSALETSLKPAETGRTFVPLLAELLKKQEVRVKCQAACLLGRIGPGAEAAVAPLAEALHDGAYETTPPQLGGGAPGYRSVAWLAAVALQAIGQPAVPELIRALASPVEVKLPEACYDQGIYIGDYGSQTLRTRALAAEVLGRIGPAAKRAVPELTRLLLHDPEPGVRGAALRALLAIEPKGAVARAACPLLRHKDSAMSRPIVEWLWSDEEAAKAVVPELRVFLADNKCPNRDLIIRVLQGIGAIDAEAIPVLIKAAQQKRKLHLRRAAVQALGHLGPTAALAVPSLQQLLLDPETDQILRACVQGALRGICPQEPPLP